MSAFERVRGNAIDAPTQAREREAQVRQQILMTGRRNGKTAAMRRAIYEARERGEHVHVVSGKGGFCAAREQPQDCHLPRWEGLEP